MRTRVWFMSVVLASLAMACGDQPTEVVPEREMTQGQGMIAAATSTSGDGLSITTDKDDYQPGDTVWLTGAGWPAGDTLDILLEDEPATHEPHSWWVQVEDDGTFRDSTYIVDLGDLGVTFTLRATGRESGRSLTVQFTDAELVTSELTGTVNDVTVTQGSSSNFTISLNATGAIKCAATATNPATAKVHTAFSISAAGAVSSATLSSAFNFFGGASSGGPNNCSVTWTGAPTPYTASASVSAASGTPVGDYVIALQQSTGRVVITNPTGMGGSLDDATATTINVHVVAAANQAPIAKAGGPYSGNEGAEIELDGTGSSDPDNHIPLTYSWSIILPLDAAFDGGSCSLDDPTAAKPKITCDDDGQVTVRLTVKDSKGLPSAAASDATVRVTNANPTANAGGAYSGDEGSAISLTGLGDDDGENDKPSLTFAWSVNKSGIDGAGDCVFSPANTAQNPTITCTDDSEQASGGYFTVSLTVRDDDGGVSEVSTSNLTLNNVAPAIQSLKTGSTGTLDLPPTVVVGTTLDIMVTFGDNGSNDTHKSQIDCGSGSYGAESSVNSPFTTPCTFNTIGKKTVNVKVMDDDTQSNSDVESREILVVYDFDGFFAPVDRPNMMNVSKAGQSIPLKWRITDVDGVGVTTLATVAVKAVGTSCTGYGTSSDQIEEYASGSSGLQNLGDGYYQFNWKTPTGYANSCKTIALTFGTGYDSYTEEPSAYFSFKK